jgi:hypothetical protein
VTYADIPAIEVKPGSAGLYFAVSANTQGIVSDGPRQGQERIRLSG